MFQTIPSRPVLALVMPAVNCMNALLPFSVGVHSITNRPRPVSLPRAICGQRKRRKRGCPTRQCGRKLGLHTRDVLNLKYLREWLNQGFVGRNAPGRAIIGQGIDEPSRRLPEERT